MASNQAKTIEAKKDEFRAYLEKTGCRSINKSISFII